MLELLVAHALLASLAALVVLFVAFPYRGRNVPRAERLTEKVAEVAERVAPGQAPPWGVLGDRDRDREVSARFEAVENKIRRTARAASRK